MTLLKWQKHKNLDVKIRKTHQPRESVSTFYPFWMHDYYEYLFIIWDAIWKYFLTYHDHVKFSGQKLLKNENNKSATCAIISKLRLRRICWHLQNKVCSRSFLFQKTPNFNQSSQNVNFWGVMLVGTRLVHTEMTLSDFKNKLTKKNRSNSHLLFRGI